VSARLRVLVAGLAAALLSAGCLFRPLASTEEDERAKAFVTHPSAASIYVYRSRFNHLAPDSVLYLDGRMIGMTQPGSCYRLDTTPGVHTVHGTGSDSGEMMVTARPGQLYFVSMEVIGGHSRFTLVAEETGREQLRGCCVMLEPAPLPQGTFVW